MSFNQFRLSSDILKGLKDGKIESPSPIQKKILKAVQEGSDLVINTTSDDHPEVGYMISTLSKISKSGRRQGTRAIILAADKQRAKQIDEWIWAVGYHASIESVCLTEEKHADEQISALAAGPVVIVATPDRLLELLEKGKIIFREVGQFVVDQAELIEDWSVVDAISKRVIGKCQRIFIAAKDSKDLREAEQSLLQDPALITTSASRPKTDITEGLIQYYINVPPRSKISTLMAHLNNHKTDTVVIFAASRRTADRLYKVLRKNNRRAVSIHDKLDKEIINERFEKFISGNVQHLIIGELSAADLPIEQAIQVINYDVPEDVNEYKLRAELVGNGKATRLLSLVSKQDRSDIHTICKSLGYAPEEMPLPKGVQEQISSPDKQKNGKPKQHSHKKKGHPPGKKKSRELNELPRPTFDQLSGGRTGKKKKKGLVGFFRQLFS